MASVDDEWDTDLLRVTYYPQQITEQRLIEKIAQEGFEAKVK